MPTQGREDVTAALIEHIHQRQQKGIRTYGTSLMTFNGRSALQDALDEALDLAQYLQQEMMERHALEAELRRLQRENAQLRAELGRMSGYKEG